MIFVPGDSSTVGPTSGTAAERVHWAFADGWTVACRGLVHWVRNPMLIVSAVLYPAVTVVLFGYVFGSAMAVPGGGDYREFLMPGLFAQTMVFGVAMTTGIVAADVARGVTDRFRSMPMSQAGMVVGRGLADMVSSALELGILLVFAWLVGWEYHNGPVKALAAVALLFLLRFALIWIGIYVGLHISPQAAGASWMILMPLVFFSNTFVAPAQMPGWLEVVATWNPVSATVAAIRELFGNPGVSGDSWVVRQAVPLSVGWSILIVGTFLPLAVRRYRRFDR